MKKLLKLFVTVVSAIAVILLIKETGENFYSGLISVPIYVLYKDKIGELYSEIKTFLGEDSWKKKQKELGKKGLLNEDTSVRISFAYLFRIKIDDKYFLVPNTRTKKYQPVGGAYKFNEIEASYFSENIPVEYDEYIIVDNITKKDYRLFVKNKNLKEFIRRFDKTPNRENINDLSREFKEEIFASGILDEHGFGNLSYKYCGRHMTSIVETVFHPFEILLADVVEVRLTPYQESLFKNLIEQDSNKYKFATAKEIKAEGIKTGTQYLSASIANHTFKILSEKSDKLKGKNKYKSLVTVTL